MENTRQPIPLRIRQHLRDAVGRMHPSVSFVSCIGVLLAYLTGVYITGSLHEASRWMGAMLACTSLVVVLQSHNYKDSLRAGWTRVLGTFLGALVAYIYLKIWPFSIVGMLASVFVLEMLCMLVGIYQNNRIATITLLIILLVSQMTPHVSPAVHVEMAAEEDTLKSHDVIDNIERDFHDQDNIHLVVHYDPIVTGDAALGTAREWVREQVARISPQLSMHDFRMVTGPSHTNLIFDVVVPADFSMTDAALRAAIQQALDADEAHRDTKYYTVITVDHSYAPYHADGCPADAGR